MTNGATGGHGGHRGDHYDEFGWFHENAAEFGLPFDSPPAVTRVTSTDAAGRRVSALRWGADAPEVVLLHGGAQNAHTWDTVALALARPLLAVDLPGHGHSDHRDDHAYWPAENAAAVEHAVREHAPDARVLVGMSLGGLSAIALAARAPERFDHLVLVDVTPGVDHEKASSIVQFVDGPESFSSFDEILERTIAFNPTRSESSLRRGVLHNARPRPDGRWEWRYDLPRRPAETEPTAALIPGLAGLWDEIERVPVAVTLVRGAVSPVVSDDDVRELQRRRADARVIVVDGAGHSVQGDRPLELAAILSPLLP
ncbi:MAG TPA: alpha/beta hydrolase [Acidimicrobiia bacterium]|nr:alpha/beta hydrolase [Acidimicrobiia bacterium]